MCLTRYTHAWVTFMAHGFTHHQQAMNYLGTPAPGAFREDLAYGETDQHLPGEWGRQSWKGHCPKLISARRDGESVGSIGYAELPYLSNYRQKRVAGIYSMGVNERLRRQGIATSLIRYLFNQANEQGVEEILVGTTVENTAARRTYEKGGMKPIAFRTGMMYQERAT